MPALRIAVIGAGQIGRRHLGVLLADKAYEAAALVDPNPATEALAREHGMRHFIDHEQMLDRVKPDGAVVATPNQHHVSVALACIARRVPVLVEKPIADTLASGIELVDTAARAGTAVLVGHHRRHNPIMRLAAETIRAGRIGTVVAATGMWLAHKPDDYFNIAWRREAGGGPLLINAIHDIDCLRMLCGDIVSVQASTARGARHFPVEDTAAAVLQFASGALGTLIVSDAVSAPWSWEWTSRENPFYPPEAENCFLIAGSRGSLAVPSLDLMWHEPGQGWGDSLTHHRLPVTPADPYVEQMRNFAEVIRGKAAPVVSGAEGLRTLAAIMAIAEAGAEGRSTRIDDILDRHRQRN